MHIETTSCVRDDATGNYTQTLTLKIDSRDLDRAVLNATGFDGLGDPTTSKGLQQVIYSDGRFEIMPYHAAVDRSNFHPEYVTMVDVAALRVALRQVLN